MPGRRRAVQAGDDLGRAGRYRLERLCDAGQIGRQRADAHHRAARANLALAVVMVRGGRVLRGLVMRVHGDVIMRRAVVQVARWHGVMDRHEISQPRIVETRRRAGTPGKACSRREYAEQIGQRDEAPHFDPHRSRQSQQHSDSMLRAALLHTQIAN